MTKKHFNWVIVVLSGLLVINTVLAEEVAVPVAKTRTSYVLTIDENARVEAKIAANVMNRLAVINDRIVNIFGEEETFTIQTDEHTGQVFIKPTPDNGNKPIALTIITENGLTQDLTLIPTQTKAATIILKQAANKSYNPGLEVLPGLSRNQTKEEEWLRVLKQAVLGELPVLPVTGLQGSRKVANLQIKFNKCYQAGAYFIQVWKIKNNSRELQELHEKQFFNGGDIALSLTSTTLAPDEQTLLYVLRAFS